LLCKLDSVIGDGDHGMTIAKGFDSVMEKIEKTQPENISDLLKTTGNAIIVTIGGVAGPIFGTLFSELGRTISSDTKSVDIKVLSLMFSASLAKIMKLGGARPGDKTMVDAFYPAVKSLEDSAAIGISIKEALIRMTEAARKVLILQKTGCLQRANQVTPVKGLLAMKMQVQILYILL